MKLQFEGGQHIRRESLWAAAFVIIHVLLLAYLAIFRYVDRDEGFYLSAALQVAGGKSPYLDFFFPQMPLLPYILSIIAGHGFDTLRYARFLCLIPATLTPIVFWYLLKQVSSGSVVRLSALFVYLFAGLVLVWHSVAKTYAWTDLALVLMFICLVKIIKGGKGSVWLAAGVAFGLAINFRSVLVVTAFPAMLVLWHGPSQTRMRSWWQFLGGALAVSLTSVKLLFQDPSRFYFNNLGFHFVRNPGVGFADAMLERGEAFGKFLINPQLWLILLGIVVIWRKRSKLVSNESKAVTRLALWFALVIIAVYLIPSPVHVQYFQQALPFLIIASLPGLELILAPSGKFLGMSRGRLLVVGGVIYMAALLPFAVIYVGAIRHDDRPYSIRNTKELSQFVRDYPEPGPILSEWAGVPVLSGREGLGSTEFVGFQYQMPGDAAQFRTYHLPVNDDLKRALEDRIPVLYIVWNQPDSALTDVAGRNYHQVDEFEQFKVLARNEISR
ncbi:MAG: glycosyltransferase family 39 protein [Candidatus Zixiibacteriota bacterium]